MKLNISGIIDNKDIVDIEKHKKSIEATLRTLATNAKVDFEKTVSTWDFPASFETGFGKESDVWYSEVFTNDNKYYMLNVGAKPHRITARNAPKLTYFAKGFSPKSKPRYIGSLQGSNENDDWQERDSVYHPGFTARSWDEAIKEKWESKVLIIYQQNMKI